MLTLTDDQKSVPVEEHEQKFPIGHGER
jgi:hypothetical protein